MPLILLAAFIADLLSFAYPVIAYYLWREWDKYRYSADDEYAQRCLYALIAIGILIVAGRFIIKMLVSKARIGGDEPHMFEPVISDKLQRPDGTVINVEYYGKEDGQPIILLHGMNANTKNWYYQKQFFEKDYRLIMMDLRGLGKSTKPGNKDFSLDKYAADLNAVIEHTGARNAILWGHSMGGMTILTLVAKHSDWLTQPLKGIILEHTTYTNPAKTSVLSGLLTAIQKPVLHPICWLLILLSPLFWLGRWMSYINGNAHLMSRILTFAGTQTAKQLDYTTLLSTMAPPATTGRGMLAMFRYDVTDHLSNINVPALIIAANKDKLTKADASYYMRDNIPGAKLFMAHPANHQGLVERHAEVNNAAREFMQALEAQAIPTHVSV